MVHYFTTAAMQDGLKSHYLSEWDHRNLLHVWPLKAFPHYRSQVRIYWNQFFMFRQMAALHKMEMNGWAIEWTSERMGRSVVKDALVKGSRQSRRRWAGFKSASVSFLGELKRLWTGEAEEDAGTLCLIKVEIQSRHRSPKGSHQKVHPTLCAI